MASNRKQGQRPAELDDRERSWTSTDWAIMRGVREAEQALAAFKKREIEELRRCDCATCNARRKDYYSINGVPPISEEEVMHLEQQQGRRREQSEYSLAVAWICFGLMAGWGLGWLAVHVLDGLVLLVGDFLGYR
jgi:hypothetical protein